MDKLKKVIKGLEMSYTLSNVDEDNTLVPQQLVLDAIALLKAQEEKVVNLTTKIAELTTSQEPRVMTLEEVTEDCPDVVWFDDRHFVRVFAALPKNENYHGWVKFIWRDGCERHDHIDGYGKEWRCWSSRPTDEQREKVKWE